ncbi:MAG: amino acid permease [Eggerthellaceae bacterium]|nr:amino acid permease [Eggerthellaceae bacterium]
MTASTSRPAAKATAQPAKASAPGKAAAQPSDARKVGLVGLTAIVISAMVGGGIYNLPQSMSESASAGSQILAWLITGVGMWFIANTFRILAQVKPQLKNGIYTYAERGFGRFVGFLIAYGYWICNCIALVAYGVMIMATMDYFFPGAFSGGNNIASVIGASAVTWLMFALACRGVKSGALINVVGTIGKIVPVLIFIVAIITVFQLKVFLDGFWGYAASGAALSFNFGDVMGQVSGTMAVTLFLFTGIEGAVVVSGEAKSQSDVSKATTLGFIVVLLLYSAVSILPLGVYSSTDIAGMADPSMAAIMQDRFGDAGSLIVNVGVIIAVLSSWLVWMLMLAQMPLYAARDGIFPKRFTAVNAKGAPSYSLLWSTIVIQVALVASHFMSGDAWDTIIDISAVMCMPCYMMCAAFLWKVAVTEQWPEGVRFSRANGLVTGVIGTLFAVYLLYSSGLTYDMVAAALYAVGVPLFVIGRRQAGATGSVASLFTRGEKVLCVALVVVGVAGIVLAATSHLFS